MAEPQLLPQEEVLVARELLVLAALDTNQENGLDESPRVPVNGKQPGHLDCALWVAFARHGTQSRSAVVSFESAVSSILSEYTVGRSGWEFVTSAGASVSVGTPVAHVGINIGGGLVRLRRGKRAPAKQFNFRGVGGSLGLSLVPSPVNLSFSLPQMPSAGVVYKLPYAGRSLDECELTGGCILMEFAADVGPGVSGATLFVGGSMLFASAAAALTANMGYLPALLASSNGVVFFGGMMAAGLPFNVSVAVSVGAITSA